MRVGANLYKTMLTNQEKYKQSFIALDAKVREFFKGICDEENSRIRVDEYNFVIVRSSEEVPVEALREFQNEFDVKLMWEQDETIRDYRNVEGNETAVTVHEYGFAPKSIQNGDSDGGA